MESLELDVAAFIPQQVHHEFEILRLADVFRHDGEIVTVKKQLPQKLHHIRAGEKKRNICLNGSLMSQAANKVEGFFFFF